MLAEGPIRSVFQAAVGEGYRLQARARNIAARARLPQAQSTTVLDEPLESVVQALLRTRPAFHEPGQRAPRALGSRADVLRAEALLDEAEAELALLASLGIGPAVLGPKAEEAGMGPAAVKASAALRALVEAQLRGEPFSLRGAAEESSAKAAGFDDKLDELLRGAAHGEIDGRVSQRLRSMLRGRPGTSARDRPGDDDGARRVRLPSAVRRLAAGQISASNRAMPSVFTASCSRGSPPARNRLVMPLVPRARLRSSQRAKSGSICRPCISKRRESSLPRSSAQARARARRCAGGGAGGSSAAAGSGAGTGLLSSWSTTNSPGGCWSSPGCTW